MTDPEPKKALKTRLEDDDIARTAMYDHFREEDHVIVEVGPGGRHHITDDDVIRDNITYALTHLTMAQIRYVNLDTHMLEIWVATPAGASLADRDKRWTARLTVDDSSTVQTTVTVKHYGPKA